MIKYLMLMSFIVSTLTVSTAIAQSDSLSSKSDELTQTPEKEGYPIYAIGGIGVTLWDTMMDKDFQAHPVIALGAELPFTQAHIFAFQLYSYSYIGKQNNWTDSDFDNAGYFQISNNYYAQIALLGEIKCYLSNINNKLRVSFNLGYLFCAAKTSDYGIDYGIGASYKINTNLFAELNLRKNLGRIDFGGNSGSVPSLLMLNMYYNINGD